MNVKFKKNQFRTSEEWGVYSSDWERSGLLDGLEGDTRDAVVKHFNEIDFEKFRGAENTYELVGYILPVIRRIITGITSEEPRSFQDFNNDEVLSLVDVEEICGLLYVYTQGFIPFAGIFLPNLDYEAESVRMFCDNYIIKLIDRVKKQPCT